MVTTQQSNLHFRSLSSNDIGSATISISIAGRLFLDADKTSTSLAGNFYTGALGATGPTAPFRYEDI
jgi:hypothetical protein